MPEGVENLGPSRTAGGNAHWHSYSGKQRGDPQKTENRMAVRFSGPTPGHTSGQNYNSERSMEPT